jgi:hypothetical protein
LTAAIEVGSVYTEKDAETSTVLLRVRKAIYDKIERRLLKSSEFNSVDAYAEYVLDQVLDDVERQDREEQEAKKQEDVFSKEDQEDIEQRLRDLGYL